MVLILNNRLVQLNKIEKYLIYLKTTAKTK